MQALQCTSTREAGKKHKEQERQKETTATGLTGLATDTITLNKPIQIKPEEVLKHKSPYLERLPLFFSLFVVPRLIIKGITLPHILQSGAHSGLAQ